MAEALALPKRKIKTYGWKRDLPDYRDKKYSVPRHVSAIPLPNKVDLRTTGFLPPVYDQGELGSCTGNAIAAALEFDRKKQALDDWTPSRLFIYYNERSIENDIAQDGGAQIRDGIKAVATAGACKETTWPYVESQFAVNPPQAAWDEAKLHEAVNYEALDQRLEILEGCLASGYPIVFGFTVYDAFESDEVAQSGVLNMPAPNEGQQGGHAVLLCGYDFDAKRFLVRNSWGPEWGQAGYFTIPYGYVLSPDLADDFWTIRVVQ